MIPELAIVRYFLDFGNYSKYNRYISVSKELREVKTLHQCLDLLHKKYPDTNKTVDELEAMVYSAYPNLRPVEREAYADLFKQLREIEVRPELLESLLTQVATRSKAGDLARAAYEVHEGRAKVETLTQLAAEIQAAYSEGQPSWKSSRNFVTDDLFELEQHTIRSPGLRWRLSTLNRSLGPIRQGDFGFVFARPESGKTTFLADQITFFAEQATRPIIWFNNEEQGEKVRLRTFQACLGLTSDELWKDKKGNLEKYRSLTKGQLRIYDDASIHRNEVEAIISELNPELVVFDQIDKIKGFDADRPDLVYGRIYQWARELAKRGCAIIGICQAGGEGEGVKWLTMAHVAEAKTSKQAEADWILGIGRSNESGTEDIRFFNISKNKLLGDDQTDPNLRHGRFEVFIRPAIARYEDLE